MELSTERKGFTRLEQSLKESGRQNSTPNTGSTASFALMWLQRRVGLETILVGPNGNSKLTSTGRGLMTQTGRRDSPAELSMEDLVKMLPRCSDEIATVSTPERRCIGGPE
jgi:hypothetical protein